MDARAYADFTDRLRGAVAARPEVIGLVALNREESEDGLAFNLGSTMMRSMIQTPKHERADLSCLRRCLSSGEVLSPQLYEEWMSNFGIEVLDRFGSAESGMGYLCNRPGKTRPGSSGNLSSCSCLM